MEPPSGMAGIFALDRAGSAGARRPPWGYVEKPIEPYAECKSPSGQGRQSFQTGSFLQVFIETVELAGCGNSRIDQCSSELERVRRAQGMSQ
jgi:hypothetical protein